MQKSVPQLSGKLDGHGNSVNSGSFKKLRRQSTPIVYTRVVDNCADAKSSEHDQTTITRPRNFLKHQCFSLSNCDITLARKRTDREPFRSERLRAETNDEPKGDEYLRHWPANNYSDVQAANLRRPLRPRLMVSDELLDPLEITTPEGKSMSTAQVHERKWSTGKINIHDSHDSSSFAPENQDTLRKIGCQMDVQPVNHVISARAPRRSTRDSVGPSEPLNREPRARSSGTKPNFQASNRSSAVSPCKIEKIESRSRTQLVRRSISTTNLCACFHDILIHH